MTNSMNKVWIYGPRGWIVSPEHVAEWVMDAYATLPAIRTDSDSLGYINLLCGLVDEEGAEFHISTERDADGVIIQMRLKSHDPLEQYWDVQISETKPTEAGSYGMCVHVVERN